MQIDPIAVAAGVRLEALATIGSTNQEARSRARRGERGPLWITAEAQTKGRGRSGRSWFSPPGNLYASLLLADPSPIDHAPGLAFVAALAVRDAIIAEAPALAPHLAFKWPNDLLLAGAKCAGILIEGEVESGQGAIVVIGIGVNCAHHPENAPDLSLSHPMPFGGETMLYPATDLGAKNTPITPERLFQKLSATMCRRVAQWDRGRGFAAIRSDWLGAARGIGETITVRNGDSEKTGRFAGLDRSGRLVLELPDGGTESIAAGDVFPFDRQGGGRVPSQLG